jgi:hypothetical protein
MQANRSEMSQTDASFLLEQYRADMVALGHEERELMSLLLGKYLYKLFETRVSLVSPELVLSDSLSMARFFTDVFLGCANALAGRWYAQSDQPDDVLLRGQDSGSRSGFGNYPIIDFAYSIHCCVVLHTLYNGPTRCHCCILDNLFGRFGLAEQCEEWGNHCCYCCVSIL